MIRNKILLFAGLAALAASGAASAQAVDDRQPVQDTRGGVVHNTTGNCVRTQWMSPGDVCSDAPVETKMVWTPPPPAPPPPPVKRTVISEADRTVYFPFNKAGLTAEAKAQLDTLAATLKAAKDIQEAKVVGTADRIGSVGYNDKLSQKRAEAVRDYLIARGYTNASVTQTRWVGKSEPITNCPKKMPHKKLVACLQNDRRVMVDIVYKSEVVAPAAVNYNPGAQPQNPVWNTNQGASVSAPPPPAPAVVPAIPPR